MTRRMSLLSMALIGILASGVAACGGSSTGGRVVESLSAQRDEQSETPNAGDVDYSSGAEDYESDDDAAQTDGIESGEESKPANDAEPVQLDADVTVEETSHFSEGLAWVKYKVGDEEDTTWAGYIDKTGKLVFRYKCSSSMGGSDFSNGHAYLLFRKLDDQNSFVASCKAIDTKGTVLSELDHVVCWGGGYVVTSQYNAGFDNTSYTYHVFSDDGDEIIAFESENELDEVMYCGEDIISFGELKRPLLGSKYHHVSFLYDVKKNTKIEMDHDDSLYFNPDSKKALYDVSNNDGIATIQLMSTDANIEEHVLNEADLGGALEQVRYRGDLCALYIARDADRNSRLYSYSISSGTLQELDHRYADVAYGLENASFNEDRCVLSLKGADGEQYVGVFDTALKPVAEPIKASENTYSGLEYSDGRLIVEGTDSSAMEVYDLDGKLVYTADSLGSADGYREELLLYEKDGQIYCRDLQGEIVFDKLSGLDAPVILE